MPTNPDNAEEIQHADREVAATMQMISSAQQGMEGFEAGKIEEAGENMIEEMMAQFESLGEKEDYNEVDLRAPKYFYLPVGARKVAEVVYHVC
jgi:hypothetical protein